MRTIDPSTWTKKVKKSNYRIKTLPIGLPQASTFEMRLRMSFRDAFRELFQNYSAFGVRLMHKDILEPYRYVILGVFLWTVAWGMAMFVWGLVVYRSAPPLLVNLQPQQHRHHLAFPGIAICSHNLVSRKALRSYAMRLAALDNNSTFTVWEIEQNLVAFGALITSAAAPFDLRFVRFLARVERGVNVTNIVLKLSPSCEELLVRCSWKAKITACNMLFATRLTPNGFCCVMNSRYSPEDATRAPMSLNTVDHTKGLILIVQENPEDFAYLRRPGSDVEVIIFDGDQYPLKESTGVRSYPAPKNATLFLKLNSWIQTPAPSLQYYSDQARGCLIPPPGAPSEVDCLMQCRRRAARVLCSCEPHYLLTSPRVIDARRAPPPTNIVCTPVHLPCLIKHREMMSYYYPGYAIPGLEEETSDSIDCRTCHPHCYRTVHSAIATYTDFTRVPLHKQFCDQFVTKVDFTNTSVIRIFMTQDDERLYVLESNLRWFQTTATIGSQWMFICGVSLVSSLEVVYFCTVRWYHHYRRRKNLFIR